MKKLIVYFLILSCLVPTLSMTVSAGSIVVDSVFDIRTSAVEDDLNRLYIAGKRFDSADYPVDETADYMQLISFLEYGFSKQVGTAGQYGLYVYLHNPSGDKPMQLGSDSISLAFGDGLYNKYKLFLMDESDDHLFLKFRVILPEKPELEASAREYHLAGIEIETKKLGLRDYDISGKLTFTGYQNDLSLKCESDVLLTVHLDLHQTFYRLDSSDAGVGFQEQLDSVYFALPNWLMDTYGEVYGIRVHYIEDRIDGVGLYSEEWYNKMYLLYWEPGVSATKYPGYSIYSGWNYSGLPDIMSNIHSMTNPIRIGFNLSNGAYNGADLDCGFLISEGDLISSEMILDFMNQTGFISNRPNTPYGWFDYEENSKTVGTYIRDDGSLDRTVEITIKDSFDLISFDENHNWFEKMLLYGLFTGDFQESEKIEAIQKVTDISGTNALISSQYKVDLNDVEELKTVYSNALIDDKSVYVFHFDKQTYYSTDIFCGETPILQTVSFDDGYYFSQNIYLDFDVIDISFEDDAGRITVLPVVSDPIDIIGDATAPIDPPSIFEQNKDAWLRTFAIILGIVLLIALFPLILKLVGWLLGALAGGTSSAVKSAKSHRKRRR